MTINNDLDFEPPFGSNNNSTNEEQSNTYQPISVNLSAKDVEFLSDLLMCYISDNTEVLTDEEFQEIDDVYKLLEPGIIPPTR